jgi:thiosulfate/3-mercaptopyruvate sulfurtransferase
MRNLVLSISFGLFACTAVAAEMPQTARDAAIVDTAYVEQALKHGAIVWDVRDVSDYKKGHIPGAVNIGEIGKVLRDYNTEDYLPQATVEKILADAGIDPTREIVVYGAKGNPFVYFGLVTVEYFNGKHGHIYHGGIDDWKAAGQPLATEPTVLPPIKLHLTVNPAVMVSTQGVLKQLHKRNVQIVDVRTPKEYAGEDVRAIRGGHVPGAVNIPFEDNWVDPETPKKIALKKVNNKDGLALKPRDQLKKLYAGLDPNKETVVYCQSGVRASETATVLKDLGFKNVKVYDSSWLGYGNTLSAPAADVTFFNVGAMNGKLAALQHRIDTLEKEVAESTKK